MLTLTPLVASLCLALVPQTQNADPTSPARIPGAGTPADPFVHAVALPRDTALILSWNGNAAAPWQRALATMPAEVRSAIPKLLQHVATTTGVGPRDLLALTRARVTIGVTGLASAGVSWLGVAEFGDDGPRVQEMLSKLFGCDLTNEGSLQTIAPDRSDARVTFTIGRRHSAFVFGPDDASVGAALLRLDSKDGAKDSVVSSIRFGRFLEQCGDDARTGSSYAAAFLDVSSSVDAMLQLAPEPMRATVANAIEAGGFRQIFALGFIAHDVDDLAFDHVRVCFPEPRKGLPSLFTGTTRLDETLARFVPADTPSWSLFHIDTDRLLEEALVFANAFDASAAGQLREMLSGVRQRFEIDVENDVLAALGRRVVALQWPTAGETDGVLMMSVRNPIAIGKALRNTRMFKSTVTEHFEIHRMQGNGPILAIGEGMLITGSSEQRVQQVLENFRSGQAHAEVAALLNSAQKGTSSMSWSDASRMATGHLEMLATLARSTAGTHGIGLSPKLQQRVAEFMAELGPVTHVMTTDPQGLSIRGQGKFGAIGAMFAVGCAVATEWLEKQHPSLAGDDIARQVGFAWRLGEIARAVRENGLDLPQLVASGALSKDVIGEPVAGQPGHYELDDYRIALTIDPTGGGFVAFAWPAARARGAVFACTENGVPIVNNVMTMTAGIDTPTPRDLFLGGSFGNQLTTGWQPIHTIAAEPSTHPSGEQATILLEGPDWTDYQSLLAAGRGDLRLQATDVVRHLDSSHPIVVARAARTMVELDVPDAAPELCARVMSIDDSAARQQIVQAIADLEDPRALPTLRELLTDSDIAIRTVAARAIGILRDAHSIEQLVDVVVRKDPEPDQSDRIQALLSLADVGDTSCLRAISACPTNGARDGQAIAFLFQQLSPKMPAADEAALLMSVLEHAAPTVRRYAIQRLGELRDPNSINALERRLATETDELRPLVEVSLSAVRGPTTAVDDTPTSAPTDAGPFAAATGWFRNLDSSTRNLFIAGASGLVLLAFGLLIVMLRRRNSYEETDWSTMTGPSELEPEFDAPAGNPESVHDSAFEDVYGATPTDEYDDEYAEADAVGGDYGRGR